MSWTADGYWLTRTVFESSLALLYLIAFLNALSQFQALAGEHGLLPVGGWTSTIPFRDSPSLFYFFPRDWAFTLAAWAGIALSAAALTGVSAQWEWTSALVWSLMWLLYLSFVNVGQTFYAFGWESILLEAGFYAIFLGSRTTAPQFPMIVLLRWLCFRVMFGAGLIKVRGDPCWRDLTCLDYHYETQPIPNPLSWYFHWAPGWTRKAGVCFNHFCELVIPFGYFLPQPVASIAALLTILFQGLIAASGNLSWLNLLTIVLAIPALDGRLIARVLPVRPPMLHDPTAAHRALVAALLVLVVWLSVRPIRNMLSRRQIMNTAYNPLHLVGTYGAFGSITRVRYEVIVEGTGDAVVTQSTHWRAYEFRAKPGDPHRRPPQISPYHLRLDWLMWFAAMGDYGEYPWFLHFIGKLLAGDAATLSLLASNPFPQSPPRYVRAQLYRYRFSTPEEHRRTGEWWRREFVRSYFPAVSLQSGGFRRVLESQGWLPGSGQHR